MTAAQKIMAATGVSRAQAYARMARWPESRWLEPVQREQSAAHPWKAPFKPSRQGKPRQAPTRVSR